MRTCGPADRSTGIRRTRRADQVRRIPVIVLLLLRLIILWILTGLTKTRRADVRSVGVMQATGPPSRAPVYDGHLIAGRTCEDDGPDDGQETGPS